MQQLNDTMVNTILLPITFKCVILICQLVRLTRFVILNYFENSGWLIIVIIEKCEKSRSKEAIQLAYLKERLFYDFFKFLKYSQTHSTPQSQTKNSGRKIFRDILNITFKKTSFLWRILFVQKTFKVSFEISFLKKTIFCFLAL